MVTGAGVTTWLREQTRGAHDLVDAAYSRFDLSDPASYGRFLQAQARATSAAERALVGDAALPSWRSRMPLLERDLRSLNLRRPVPLDLVHAEREAWRWGVLYVVEGSRLGGAVLVERLYAGAPREFLAARHGAGEWRALLQGIERRGSREGSAWLELLVAGARACFELYTYAVYMDGRQSLT